MRKNLGKEQREKVWIAAPMTKHLELKGWWTQNITPGFLLIKGKRVSVMSGLPDLFAAKRGLRPRWIEFKIINDDNTISFKPSQVDGNGGGKFIEMMDAGIDLWVICTRIPLEKEYLERKRLYEKILDEPNGLFVRQRHLWKLLY